MGNAIVPINSQLPVAFQGVQDDAYGEFSQGVTAGFPVISYRGKVWRVKHAGEEKLHLDAKGEAQQAIELVFVRANPNLAKIFYEGAYSEGDSSPPRCWSADGVKPDAGVQNPINASCASCPKNVWGSKITPAGKKTRACADHRRMAVAFRHDVEKAATDPNHEVTMYLLRTPPASLNPLRDYIDGVLKPKGILPFAVFTRVGFDPTASHPQLTFKGVQMLNNEQGTIVVALRNHDDTRRILAEAQEYSDAGTTAKVGDGNAAAPAADAQPAAAAPASSSRKPAAPRPVEQEEANSTTVLETDEIAPASTATVETEAETDEILPASPPVPAAKPAAAKPKATKPKAPATPAVAPVVAVPAAAKGEQSFDDMLDSLLDT